MDGQISLAIAFQVESPDGDASCHGLFEDAGYDRSAFPDYCSRQPDVDGHYLQFR